MAFKVQILPTAWEDLKRIEDWYFVQFGLQTALKVSDHILDAIERLEICLLYTSRKHLRVQEENPV